MTIFKCKMCGGTLEFNPGDTVAVCDSCGTRQTLPKLDDDRRANLYDRANHFRRSNEYDKATGIYEQILTEDNTDAEAYWSLVLCRYGIEYVEDPATRKRVPTVNRAQFTSIFDDANYKFSLHYADAAQREVYEAEAKAINEIQKGILAISQKEQPFDVFICYKETDTSGRRTPDSVLANDLYHQLTQEGFKVFFARITLEDKLGTAYEPYIFAALNSAKVMVVLGTKPEYFNAVWVKNEWSRYLALVKTSGGRKLLIPAYKDMDPYDLPEEFSHLQAQDMGKLGFMQDLIRGIKKIVPADAPVQETVVATNGNPNTASLLKRAFMFLEDGNFDEADEYCEKVLDIDPENAQAYLGKLMAELRVKTQDCIKNAAEPFDGSNNYQKVFRFDAALGEQLNDDIAYINNRNENTRLTGIYNDAVSEMNAADTEEAYRSAANKLQAIDGFKDANALAEKCLEQAEICRKDSIYHSAKSKMTGEESTSYEEARKIFQTISGWKDADEQICTCQRKIEEIQAREEDWRLKAERKAEEARIAAEEAAKKRKKALTIGTIVCACIAFVIVLTAVIIPELKYNTAVRKYGQEYVDAFYALSAGDPFVFGSYEQDNNTSNGKEPIEWIVLKRKNNKILIISDKALDCQPYNTSNTDVTWENCSLRKWINGPFLNAAFSAEEQALIRNTTVSADKNPNYSTNPGNATTDKVFLLSIDETKYFSHTEERKCVPTAYAKEKGEGGAAVCFWWLRTPGCLQVYAADIGLSGGVDETGRNVDTAFLGIRPALWISLE